MMDPGPSHSSALRVSARAGACLWVCIIIAACDPAAHKESPAGDGATAAGERQSGDQAEGNISGDSAQRLMYRRAFEQAKKNLTPHNAAVLLFELAQDVHAEKDSSR